MDWERDLQAVEDGRFGVGYPVSAEEEADIRSAWMTDDAPVGRTIRKLLAIIDHERVLLRETHARDSM